MKIHLKIDGIGPVPSFKNSKQIVMNRRTGKPFIMTDKKKKAWMENAIQQLICQLRGAFPTEEGVMRGECPKPLRMPLCQLCDDSLDYLIPGRQNVSRVAKGNEGADIEIEL